MKKLFDDLLDERGFNRRALPASKSASKLHWLGGAGRHRPAMAVLAFAAMIAAASSGSRLEGLVVIGPTCAGPQLRDSACVAPLVGVTVRLLDASGRVAAEAVTDATGAFVVAAPDGRYQLKVMVPKITRCEALEVSLPRPNAAPLRITCDNGMR